MTLKDSRVLVKQYKVVNIKNYNAVGVGNILQRTLNKYIEDLNNTRIFLENENKQAMITGEVERIGVIQL